MIAGGSGVVPFRAMWRHRAAIGASNQTTLLYRARTAEETIYHEELEQFAQQPQPHGIDLCLTFTRQSPPGWSGYARRFDAAMLTDVLSRFDVHPQCFVCGPDAMVEQVANTLVDLGVPAELVRTERFGPG